MTGMSGVMHPALRTLLAMRVRSYMRQIWRGVRSVRGAIFASITCGVVLIMVSQGVIALLVTNGELRERAIQPLVDIVPVAMLTLTLLMVFTNASERAIYFSPSEVDFLFVAPFTRRELLLYKLAFTMAGSLVSAVFMSLMIVAYLPWWPSGFVGMFLGMVFVNLVSLNVSLVAHTLAESAYTKGRKLIGLLILIGILASFVQVLDAPKANLFETLREVAKTPTGWVILVPFLGFQQLVASTSVSDFAMWTLVCAGINGTLLVLAIRLDANYLETASSVSRSIDQRLRRARSTGGASAMIGIAKSAWLRLPKPPRLAGAGPVAWLQLLTALRSAHGMLALLIAIVVAVGTLVMSLSLKKSILDPDKMIGIGIGGLTYLSFLISMNPPIGLRTSGEQIPWFKTLPVRPFAIALGMTGGMSLLVSAIDWLVLLGMTLAIKPHWMTGWAALIALPLNGLLFGIDNLTFLVYPSKARAGAPGEIQTLGRILVQTLVKVLVAIVIVAPAAVLGVLLWIPTRSPQAFPAALLIVLLLGDSLLIYILARAFRRFDPSLDMISE